MPLYLQLVKPRRLRLFIVVRSIDRFKPSAAATARNLLALSSNKWYVGQSVLNNFFATFRYKTSKEGIKFEVFTNFKIATFSFAQSNCCKPRSFSTSPHAALSSYANLFRPHLRLRGDLMGSFTNSYKSLCSFIDKAVKKLETTKTNSSFAAKITKKSKTKKIGRIENKLKESNGDLSLFKFKSSVVIALVLFVVLGLLSSMFEGKIVAKLPFKPFGLVMKITHRGLQGEDATYCSMVGEIPSRIGIPKNLWESQNFGSA
ncbi:hypothetical protein ACFX2I_030849 [Malus domestica]